MNSAGFVCHWSSEWWKRQKNWYDAEKRWRPRTGDTAVMCLGNESLLESGAEIAGGSITSMNVKVNGVNGRITASDSAMLRYMDDLHPRIGYLRPQCRERILKALTLADIAHEGQLRKSGEPFIIHPVAVAVILAELRLDRDTLIAGLLHDTVEDTPVTLDELEVGIRDHERGNHVLSLLSSGKHSVKAVECSP